MHLSYGQPLHGLQDQGLPKEGLKLSVGSVNRRIVVDDPSRLPVPIKISTFNTNQPTTVQFFHKRKPWRGYKQVEEFLQPPPKRGTNLCRWFRKRKALWALEKVTKLEKKRQLAFQLDKARREREEEFLGALREQERVRLEELARREERLKTQERQLRRQAQARREEEARLQEKVRRQEQARREEEAKAQEKARRLEQARLEDERKAQEKLRREEVARLEEQLKFEEKRRAEQARLEEQLRNEVKIRKEDTPKPERHFRREEHERHVEPKLVIEPEKKEKKVWVLRSNKAKTKNIKGITAKPAAASRYVSVKTLKPHKESFNDRFVNFCYRICCQFYCCVTIILIIGCIIIFVIP